MNCNIDICYNCMDIDCWFYMNCNIDICVTVWTFCEWTLDKDKCNIFWQANKSILVLCSRTEKNLSSRIRVYPFHSITLELYSITHAQRLFSQIFAANKWEFKISRFFQLLIYLLYCQLLVSFIFPWHVCSVNFTKSEQIKNSESNPTSY